MRTLQSIRPLMKLKLTRFALLLIAGLFAAPSFAQQGSVKWPAVPGAGGYITEIRAAGGGPVTRAELVTPEYQIDVPDGDYEFRVGALNRFGKNPVFSRWMPVRVRIARVPEITGEPLVLGGESSENTLTITGARFYEQMKGYLVRGGKRYPLKPVKIEKNRAVFEVPDVDDGTYDLMLVNPLEKTATANGFVKVVGKDPVDRWQVLWRSAVLPGWGQYYAGNKIRGYIVGGTMLASLGFFMYADSVFVGKEKDFNSLEGNTNDPAFRQSLLTARGELQSATNLQNTAFYSALGVYALNLIDAAFFNGPYLSGSSDAKTLTSVYYDGQNAFVTVRLRF